MDGLAKQIAIMEHHCKWLKEDKTFYMETKQTVLSRNKELIEQNNLIIKREAQLKE